MDALIHTNIPKLLRWEKQHGSIDKYYRGFIEKSQPPKSLIQKLSDSASPDKLAQMDVALVSEYLRNVGYDIPKPDRHICRILGSKMLAGSEHETVPVYEVFDIVAGIADASGRKQAEVDYIL